MRPRPTAHHLLSELSQGKMPALSRAITLVESTLASDHTLAAQVLDGCMPKYGRAFRLGITGSPGVGKSSFIEALGLFWVENGHKVAVLSIDPTSQRTGGSILGDKTRMERLQLHPSSFIRPSPSGGYLGGVNWRTREAILLCEAAGFDRILVETVGVGQSETLVSEMTDFFLLLQQPGGGDHLQGIKRGIMEMAHGIVVTKADGDLLSAANRTVADFKSSVGYLPLPETGREAFVESCSAHTGSGISAVAKHLEEFWSWIEASGKLGALRRQQLVGWMNAELNQQLQQWLDRSPKLGLLKTELMQKIGNQIITPYSAVLQLTRRFEDILGGA